MIIDTLLAVVSWLLIDHTLWGSNKRCDFDNWFSPNICGCGPLALGKYNYDIALFVYFLAACCIKATVHYMVL